MKGHLRMAFFIKHISEYNRHAFRCWRCWQRISCNISDTSHEIIALTNVDKGSHLDEILWYALPTVDNHDSIYYSYSFLGKKQYSVLQLLAVIIFERFTHRFPCQRCQPWNIYPFSFSKSIFPLARLWHESGITASPRNPSFSNELPHLPMSNVLHGIRPPVIFMAKKD